MSGSRHARPLVLPPFHAACPRGDAGSDTCHLVVLYDHREFDRIVPFCVGQGHPLVLLAKVHRRWWLSLGAGVVPVNPFEMDEHVAAEARHHIATLYSRFGVRGTTVLVFDDLEETAMSLVEEHTPRDITIYSEEKRVRTRADRLRPRLEEFAPVLMLKPQR